MWPNSKARPIKKPRAFASTHGKWRLDWQTRAIALDGQRLDVILVDARDNEFMPIKADGAHHEVTQIRAPPGSYRLQVHSYGVRWKIVVQQPVER